MSSTEDTKEVLKKVKSLAKFANLSTLLKKNLYRRKKVQKEKNNKKY
ncbi:hypothetical protein [Rickettsia prowazekii]|uniref:Uncharacterized protein n=1 Tax=Rickettsia prowazekii (strain Rp22) TaxID=449216 RepID=D5AXM0_RICPP|nr:hypothetical protein [Rickettsia prowazekii]EOB10656.1 hypothetical protein H376_1830 [Rickettsia prowazekii str. GvF12]ADE30159.1 hypothetical protein rpr22_CDS598 [Rickettsia prowazekii str. Rp22]AFE49420.1 hypothetical protein M9W_02975 [Rickettsia prowazekii str. Chernikova]AFE50264.1 hypothetical protein M9Y_02980 [Rickettsia prowazekii str. Katsinyian]AFE51110.1 hypothetical protein MA1_02970 [Rickettsia prowazekii str. BuV67-CWPP]